MQKTIRDVATLLLMILARTYLWFVKIAMILFFGIPIFVLSIILDDEEERRRHNISWAGFAHMMKVGTHF